MFCLSTAKRPADRTRFWKTATLHLSKLPSEAHASDAAYLRSVLQWARRDFPAPERVLGVDKVLDTDVHARPKRPKRARRPYAFGSPDAVRAHRESMQLSVAAYDQCRALQRGGATRIDWPPGMYAPGCGIAAA